MKYLLGFSASILIAFTLLNVLPVRGEEKIYSDTVRLHVIAASDSEEDQAVKLRLRDAVLECVGGLLRGVTDHGEALAVIDAGRSEIKDAAEETLRGLGVTDVVTVTLGKEEYPVRYYDGFTLPAGTYDSLMVTLGEGEGHNWWCILFPAVCATDAVSARDDYVEAGFTPEQYRLIERGSGKKYKIRFKILEILSDIIGFDY